MRPLLLLLASASTILAANWPAWRGPAGDGVTTETDLPTKWSATEGIKWKIALPERGNSTPVVWGDRIFLTQNVGTRRSLLCIARADGKELWEKGVEWKDKEQTHGTNPFCSGSAVIDGTRVMAWFGSAGLRCWDMDGKELWHSDLGKQDHIWGYGASPVLHGDLCILNFGPGPRSFVVAVNATTGKEAWRFDVPAPATVEGPGDPKKDFIGSWSTGAIAEVAGAKQYIVPLPGAVWSLDPNSGKALWHCNGLNPLAYAEPLIGKDAIVALGGFSGYSIGIKPGGTGNVTETHRLWQEKRNPQRIGSGVLVGGYAYLTSEPGVIQCVDVLTGKDKWKERLQVQGGRSSSWSSLVLSGSHIYAVTQGSDVVIFKASPDKYEQVAVNSLGDGMTNSSLAVSDGQLFLRTHKSLWCIGK